MRACGLPPRASRHPAGPSRAGLACPRASSTRAALAGFAGPACPPAPGFRLCRACLPVPMPGFRAWLRRLRWAWLAALARRSLLCRRRWLGGASCVAARIRDADSAELTRRRPFREGLGVCCADAVARAQLSPSLSLSLSHTHTHTRARARTHTHARTHAHTHTRTHARTHAQSYTLTVHVFAGRQPDRGRARRGALTARPAGRRIPGRGGVSGGAARERGAAAGPAARVVPLRRRRRAGAQGCPAASPPPRVCRRAGAGIQPVRVEALLGSRPAIRNRGDAAWVPGRTV